MRKLKPSDVVRALGEETIWRIYRYADVFHCEPIEKTADDFITNLKLPEGSFNNVAACLYQVPDDWTIGEVDERLIEVYISWIDDVISNYNRDFYHLSRDYIRECYLEGKIGA